MAMNKQSTLRLKIIILCKTITMKTAKSEHYMNYGMLQVTYNMIQYLLNVNAQNTEKMED